MDGCEGEPLYQEMVDSGIEIHEAMDFSMVTMEDAVINFCSREFLENLEEISRHTKRIMFSNCMTWVFPLEKKHAAHNIISHYLYQRDEVRTDHENQLKKLGATSKFITFTPYFDDSSLEFSVKDQDKSYLGRISRQDSDKFSKDTLHIYDYIVSPKWKEGVFLGFDSRSQAKIGKPPSWIKTYANQHALSVKDFWNRVDMIIQPTDTTENLPRIGFEAMHSGKPLVVDNRGGWKTMIEHGVTGFLCNTPREFIYYGSRLCFETDLRSKIAINAKARAYELSSYESSKESWLNIFEQVYN